MPDSAAISNLDIGASFAPLALLCGDPAGVGPDIIARWLDLAGENRVGVVPVGPPAWLDTLPVPGLAVGGSDYVLTPGSPDAAGQRVAWNVLEAGAAGCRSGAFSGVVTGPVNKAWLARVGFPFVGQTEFFADRWGGDPVMAFAGGAMRVVLVTWHIPFAEVPISLNPTRLTRAVKAADRLARDLCGTADSPRIGVCGLNPHAGENGLLGHDECERLDPWLDALRSDYPHLSRCQPADTVFRRHLQGEFDVVIALYHDQGLAPLKTLEFEQSVNITLGLQYVRTSPDHGTAYSLAPNRSASLDSWDNAVRLARLLCSKLKK
ncbi:MAG: 4-hydroxythreonine-4-phosphate dehydrogenase PdxA [Puniceicoccales bacterium]|jgi:4-hydroxythreonine-4-phosphate dehydrogenase|nr:4-hydroxythreonine-4-phosphate dehydrogenase PdxA [Puniceicoccales bacterium]